MFSKGKDTKKLFLVLMLAFCMVVSLFVCAKTAWALPDAQAGPAQENKQAEPTGQLKEFTKVTGGIEDEAQYLIVYENGKEALNKDNNNNPTISINDSTILTDDTSIIWTAGNDGKSFCMGGDWLTYETGNKKIKTDKNNKTNFVYSDSVITQESSDYKIRYSRSGSFKVENDDKTAVLYKYTGKSCDYYSGTTSKSGSTINITINKGDTIVFRMTDGNGKTSATYSVNQSDPKIATVSPESATVAKNATQDFFIKGEEAGSNKTISIKNNQTDKDKRQITINLTVVDPAPVVTATAYSAAYDGASHDALSNIKVTYQGKEVTPTSLTYAVKEGEEYGEFSDQLPTVKDVSDSKVIGVIVVYDSKESEITDFTVSVTQKELTVEGTQISDKTYDGGLSASVKIIGELKGVCDTDDVSLDTENTTASFAKNEQNAGDSAKDVTVTYALKGDTAVNYIVKPATLKGAAKIKKATITVTPKALSKTYGTKNDPTLTYEYTGNATGETPKFEGVLSRETGEAVKSEGYAISKGTLALKSSTSGNFNKNNYELVVATGVVFMINKAGGLSITASSISVNYDGKSHSISASANKEGTTLTYSVDGGETYVADVPSLTNADKKTVKIKAVNNNYKDAAKEVTLEVKPITLTVTPKEKTKTYGETDPEFTYDYSGQIAGETPVFSGSLSRETGVDVGTYKILQNNLALIDGTGFKKQNYKLSFVQNKLLTIQAIADKITITAGSQSREYNGEELTDSSFSCTPGILLEGDVLTVVTNGSQTDAGSSANEVDSYKVMRGGKDITGNYSFATPVDGILKVEKRAITLTSASDSKTYDAAALIAKTVKATLDSDTTGQTEGFVEGEGATYEFTGSQTDAGNSKNEFSYELNKNTKKDNYSITKTEGTLIVSPKEVIVAPDEKTITYMDDEPELTATVKGLLGTDTIAYKIERKAGTNAGKYEIIATGEKLQGNYKVTFASGKDKFVIEPRELGKDTVVTLKGALLKENDKEKAQEIKSIVHIVAGKKATLGTDDYEIVKGTNVGTKAGNYVMTIKGKNNFKGEVRVDWMILSNDPGKVDPGKGKANIGVKEEEGAPKTEINKSGVFAAVATAEELKQVINGAKIDVVLGVKDASKSVTDAAKKEIEKAAKGKTILGYLDITMAKEFTPVNGETETTEVHKLNAPIKITIKLTDDQISTDAAVKRTYSIVRAHYNEETGKDELTVLDAVYDAANKSITFETDCFSTYALAYSDAAVPKTADSNTATMWMIVMMLTLLMAAAFAGRSFLGERR